MAPALWRRATNGVRPGLALPEAVGGALCAWTLATARDFGAGHSVY
jgi:hypothetical protein